MIGVSMGQDEQVDVAGISSRLSHVIGDDRVRRGDAGVYKADFATIDEISIDKTIQRFSWGDGKFEWDLDGMNLFRNFHGYLPIGVSLLRIYPLMPASSS
jgi:hypothetical protein